MIVPGQGRRRSAMQVVNCRRGWILALAVLLLAPGPAGAVTIDRVVSPGGVEAWLVQDHTLPIITLELSFRGGASTDPQGKAGLATMTTSLLDEGAGPFDSQEFQGRE